MYRHIALITIRPSVPEQDTAAVIDMLGELGQHPDIHDWKVNIARDRRRGTIVVKDGLFANARAFDKWRKSHQHGRLVQFLSTRADWVVANYYE